MIESPQNICCIALFPCCAPCPCSPKAKNRNCFKRSVELLEGLYSPHRTSHDCKKGSQILYRGVEYHQVSFAVCFFWIFAGPFCGFISLSISFKNELYTGSKYDILKRLFVLFRFGEFFPKFCFCYF